jgi:glycosyltransferase involved in cell wall biosynthesis
VGVAPGQRLKYEQYFDYLAANGYQVKVAPFMAKRCWEIVYRKGYFLEKCFWTLFGYLRRAVNLFQIPFYDGVYVFLWVVPFGPPFFEALTCLLNRNVIYDIDDMVHLKPQSPANGFVSLLKSPSRITHLMKNAKHVITCTPTLDALARRYNANTTDISSTINTDTYLPANPYTNDRVISLGWSGSHSTVRHLTLLREMLLGLSSLRQFRLIVIGAPDFRIEELDVTALPWRAATEVKDLQQIDIGLYPLPCEKFALGKSGLKALQYMALGIPTVATAFGANFRVIEDGVSGFLVSTEEEWKERLLLLMDHPELRRRVGERARARVVRYYSVTANRDVYLKIIEAVVGKAMVSLRSGPVTIQPGFGARHPDSVTASQDRKGR